MKCVICKNGLTAAGRVNVTLERGNTVVIVRDSPADVCSTCGEYYLAEPVATRIYAQAEDAVKRNAEGEIRRYAA